MTSLKNNYLLLGVFTGTVFVLMLQAVWLHYAYKQTNQQLMVYIKDALEQAYRKEQTYRIPVVDIVNPGAVTIESCGTEVIQIIRKCPEPDTIVYNNPSGHSIESFISSVFVDLREQILPMNICCLADLFAGMLHEKDIPAYFVVERIDVATGELLDTSLLPDKKQPEMNPETILLLEISKKESLRAIIELRPAVVLGQMTGILTLTICLIVVVTCCFAFIYHNKSIAITNVDEHPLIDVEVLNGEMTESGFIPSAAYNNIFNIGQYIFDPAKNELNGFDESIQLNKKENTILYALCAQCGNVVERGVLLSENWGSRGEIYSRSLDTYITALRRYLKKDPSIQIVTIKGVGYKIVSA